MLRISDFAVQTRYTDLTHNAEVQAGMVNQDNPANLLEGPAPAAEDLASSDDQIIGRALRWSLVALVVIAAGAGIVYWAVNIDDRPPVKHREREAIAATTRAAINPPTVAFTDITRASGIRFVHYSGASGEKLLPETMGGGVAFFDFDNDGFPDLLFVNAKGPPALYHNDGHSHFIDVTPASGISTDLFAMGVAVGDYDNDGLVDVLITGVGGCRLFRNEGAGHFHDVTGKSGVAGSGEDWSTSAAFIDYDNDGRLDLFVCNYVRWSRELDLQANYTLTGVGRAFGPPTNFQGSSCRLYHNEGAGCLRDVSAEAGIQVRNKDTGVAVGKSLGVAPIDLDGDGFIDFVVANDTVQNFVFHNRGNGTFEEIGAGSGIGFDSNGVARGAMGIDAAYFRNDDALGIAVGNFANEMMAMYVSRGQGGARLHFTDDAIAEGVGGPSRIPLKFGLFYFDYDLDGWLDLLCVDGHIEPEISKVQAGQRYAQPAQLYWNAGSRSRGFATVDAARAGPELFHPIVGRGCAYADIDADGDPDIVLTQIDGPPILLRNDQHTAHHFLCLKLVGNTCNRDAIGAWVVVRANGKTLQRQVMPARGYLSQSELPMTIGLGDAAAVESVNVKWPGGATQKVEHWVLDSLMTVTQE